MAERPDAGGDLTLEAHDGASQEMAARRSPRVTLLRHADGLGCRVAWNADDRPRWIEFRRDEDPPDRQTPGSEKEDARISFTIATPLPRVVTIRSGFPDGQVWRRTVEL